jgi:ubiquitin C-terminal hydrolase
MNEISDYIFNHLDNKNQYPINRIELLIHKYAKQKRDNEQKEESQKIAYAEKYDAPRNVQNEMYDTYVRERNELFNSWKSDKAKGSLYKMLNMEFKFQDIPEIYTHTIISTKEPRQKQVHKNADIDIIRPSNPKIPEKKLMEIKESNIIPPVKNHTDTTKKPKKNPLKTPIRCGIKNMGASCYINSSLQLLLHIDEFNKTILNISKPNEIAKAYINIYNAYQKNTVPSTLIDELIKSMNNKGSQFDVLLIQDDIFEFIFKLIEYINDENIKELFKVIIQTSISFHKTIKKGKNELKCDEEKSPKETPESSITIEITDTNKVYKIKDELSKRFKGIIEKVSTKDNFIDCDKPYDISNDKKLDKIEKFPYTRIDKIINAPLILIMQMKIFDLNNKLFIKLEIPNSWVYENNKYRLRGIVAHIGETREGGHYIYYSMEDNDTKWYKYDDNNFDPHNDDENTADYKLINRPNGINIFNTNEDSTCPYLLYYQKIE